MTEKVKVTREQAEAIEEIKDIDYAINIHSFNKRPDSPLADMKTSELARALFVGYEVEPEFKENDWVYVEVPKEELPNVYQIMRVDNYSVNLDRLYGNHKKNEIRHATPQEIAAEKERRFWKKHGRDVWELKNGDLLTSDDDDYVEVFEGFGRRMPKMIFFKDGTKYEFSYIKEHYRIACFAENRLDVKTND